jgi:hypothetical protein
MTTSLRPWLPTQRLPVTLVFALLVGFSAITLTARSDVSSHFYVVIYPFWLAQLLAFDHGGLGKRGWSRPDFPSGRAALATVAFALMPAGVMAAVQVGVVRSGMLLGTPQEWPWLLLPMAIAMAGLTMVPSQSVWVRQWNAEQAARLVAAEHAIADARARVLQSQMQPHFLFNALNSVTALLREDPTRAKAVLVSLEGLMERSLANSQEPMTSVRTELAFVRDQLAIEQERFHDRLQVRFDVPDELLTHRIPAFSLQPLAENALRHGIARSIDGGRVDVKVFLEASHLVLRVENTGAGLDPRWREGTGFSNLRARLSSMYGAEASLVLEQAGKVTVAEVRMPLSGPRTFQPGPLVQAPGGSD